MFVDNEETAVSDDVNSHEGETNESEDIGQRLEEPDPSSGKSLSEQLDENPNLDMGDLPDIYKFKKFKIDDRVYTPEDLKKHLMRRDDYTRKTQELAQERKYITNLKADLATIRKDPTKIEVFKKIYPEEYHYLADGLSVGQTAPTPGQPPSGPQAGHPQGDPTQNGQADALKKIAEKVDVLFGNYENQRKTSSKETVDRWVKDFGAKYPRADKPRALNRLQHLFELHKQSPDEYRAPTDEDVENVFKQEHEYMQSQFEKWQSERVQAQKRANEEGTGPGAGGGIPAERPQRPRTLSEATEALLNDPAYS